MEGNYHFKWKAAAGSGKILGKYEQTIYGESLKEAVSYFESFYGALSPDSEGICNVITCIAWSPA